MAQVAERQRAAAESVMLPASPSLAAGREFELFPETAAPVNITPLQRSEDSDGLDWLAGPGELCRECRRFNALPIVSGRCHYCERAELERGMPTYSRTEIDDHLKAAFGDQGAAEMAGRHRWLISPVASYWDNRGDRPRRLKLWRQTRIEILYVPRLSPHALPCDWRLETDELPQGTQGTRLVLESSRNAEAERRDLRPAICRVRLWQPGRRGYFQWLWLGAQRQIDPTSPGVPATPSEWSFWRPALDESWAPAKKSVTRPKSSGNTPIWPTRAEFTFAIDKGLQKMVEHGSARTLIALASEMGCNQATITNHCTRHGVDHREVYRLARRKASSSF